MMHWDGSIWLCKRSEIVTFSIKLVFHRKFNFTAGCRKHEVLVFSWFSTGNIREFFNRLQPNFQPF